MLLGVAERLVVLNLLPAEGALTTLRITRELQAALSFTEEEHAALKFTTKNPQSGVEDGNTYWSKAADISREINIGPKALEVIRSGIKAKDQRGQLLLGQLEVVERFLDERVEQDAKPAKLQAVEEKSA